MENDTVTGGAELSISEAAAAFIKSTAPEVPKDHPEVEDQDEEATTDDDLQASDDDVSDEPDGETADEDDAEALGEDDEPETEQGRFVADNAKVRLADGTVTTVHELKRGNLREADYTRKTQEAAALHTETAAERERIKASEQQIEQQREFMTSLLQAIVPAKPDPSRADPRSQNYDPAGYIADQAAHETWSQYLNQLQYQQQQVAYERQAQAGETEKQTIDREWNELVGKVPEWKDNKRLERFVDELREHTPAYGITPEELKVIAYDHRHALVLRDAIAWRKLQASKTTVAKKVEGRPPVQKGGKRLSPDGHRARAATDAITRLKETGSVADAAAAFLASRKG
jgi:hypothetical protein